MRRKKKEMRGWRKKKREATPFIHSRLRRCLPASGIITLTTAAPSVAGSSRWTAACNTRSIFENI
jgi:hypothetical protein